MKYISGVLVVIALCTVIWFVHPAKGQVNQLEEKVSVLEEQVGSQYRNTIYSLQSTVERLQAQNFNQPKADEDAGKLDELSEELFEVIETLFLMNKNKLVHVEWDNRMHDVYSYLSSYRYGASLTKEEVTDLHQALKVIYFIAMDFNDIVQYDMQASYDAMHDEEHEMVERVKFRLATEY